MLWEKIMYSTAIKYFFKSSGINIIFVPALLFEQIPLMIPNWKKYYTHDIWWKKNKWLFNFKYASISDILNKHLYGQCNLFFFFLCGFILNWNIYLFSIRKDLQKTAVNPKNKQTTQLMKTGKKLTWWKPEVNPR